MRPNCDSCQVPVTERFVSIEQDDEKVTLCDVCYRLMKLGLIPDRTRTVKSVKETE